jgi:hypothetical protein
MCDVDALGRGVEDDIIPTIRGPEGDGMGDTVLRR